MNGVGTLAAALFGSCFPTTIYIGHPGWKAMGARAGYSILNGVFFTVVCLTGTLAWIAWAVPIDAGMAIVLWIGIVITAQAFQATPREHAPAVVVGLLPGVAAWGALLLKNGLRAAGVGLPGGPPLPEQLIAAFLGSDTWTHGAFALEQGFIFTAMILAAATVAIIERRFARAALWCAIAAALSLVGLMHSYRFAPADTVVALAPAWPWVIGYASMAAIFLLARFVTEPGEDDQGRLRDSHDTPGPSSRASSAASPAEPSRRGRSRRSPRPASRCSCATTSTRSARAVPRDELAAREPTLWRYRELLPLPLDVEPRLARRSDDAARLAARARTRGRRRRLLVKDEGRLPTGSFKARGLADGGLHGEVAGVARHGDSDQRQRRRRDGGLLRARRASRRTASAPPTRRAANLDEIALLGARARGRRRPDRRLRQLVARGRARRALVRLSRRCASRTASKARRRWASSSPSSSAGSCPTRSSIRPAAAPA